MEDGTTVRRQISPFENITLFGILEMYAWGNKWCRLAATSKAANELIV